MLALLHGHEHEHEDESFGVKLAPHRSEYQHTPEPPKCFGILARS